MMLQIAGVVAQRSACQRNVRVGAVISSWDYTKILAIGYNGQPRGLPEVCREHQPGNCGCIHAEVNALLKAPYEDGICLRLFLTLSPCMACAALIVNSGVRKVLFIKAYRDESPVQFLRDQGIECDQSAPD